MIRSCDPGSLEELWCQLWAEGRPIGRQTRVVIVAMLVFGVWSVQTCRYAAVYRSPLTLWHHAVEQAPYSPLAAANYASALIDAGDVQAAAHLLGEARRLAAASHVPAWERAATLQVVTEGERLILRMRLLLGVP